ncbi:AT-rich interactive domain-containing protein 2 [Caerostris darwini]|uniref:AT-rich interactive domain-containing protein 2 n=1 Tax=Caerostris darwini TaxID=1538125 RepID=A0AAV4T0X0_9ARAC|nr:AT-rich interactive domain-containing protein 2 [Caerostris darwini]
MEKLHRVPDVRQDYYAFVNELKLFHQNRGTPFRHLPQINGLEIDLLKLYNIVTSLGGLQKVIEHQKWDNVVEGLKLPKSCANFSLSLRHIYIRVFKTSPLKLTFPRLAFDYLNSYSLGVLNSNCICRFPFLFKSHAIVPPRLLLRL